MISSRNRGCCSSAVPIREPPLLETSMAPSRVNDVVSKPLDEKIGGTGKPVVEGLSNLPMSYRKVKETLSSETNSSSLGSEDSEDKIMSANEVNLTGTSQSNVTDDSDETKRGRLGVNSPKPSDGDRTPEEDHKDEKDDVFVEDSVQLRDKNLVRDDLFRRRKQMLRQLSAKSLQLNPIPRPDFDPYYVESSGTTTSRHRASHGKMKGEGTIPYTLGQPTKPARPSAVSQHQRSHGATVTTHRGCPHIYTKKESWTACYCAGAPYNAAVSGIKSVPVSASSSQQDLAPRVSPQQQFAYVNPIMRMSASDPDLDLYNQNTLTGPGSLAGLSNYKVDFEEDPPPTSPEEKSQVFSGVLVYTMSLIYGILVVVLGLYLYLADVSTSFRGLAAIYNIYLVCVSFFYLIFLYTDISRYHQKLVTKEKYERRREEAEVECNGSTTEGLQFSIHLPKKMKEPEYLPLHYNFATGRHAGSFYLKLGAAVFCFGHLIHCIIVLVYHVTFFFWDDDQYTNCASVVTLVFDVIYPIYSFFQLFFIFKYSHVMINRFVPMAIFFLAHCIASTICFWMWAIIRETMDYISTYVNNKDYGDVTTEQPLTTETPLTIHSRYLQTQGHTEQVLTTETPLTIHNDHVTNMRFLNESLIVSHYCYGPSQMVIIRDNFSPYLYPFTIEYSIIVAGILYVIWHNIGHQNEHGGGEDHSDDEASAGAMDLHSDAPIHSGVISSNMFLSADCRSSNKGFFAGMIALLIAIVNILLHFISISSDDGMIRVGKYFNVGTLLGLLLSMMIAVVWAYFVYFRKLDVNHHPISLLDDILLFICMPAFFLYIIASLAATIFYAGVVYNIVYIVMVNTPKVFLHPVPFLSPQIVQVLIQTPFIIDGLRRCCNSQSLRKRKPGRELITFLIVVNVAMWISETFDVKSVNKHDLRYDFYGKGLWSIIKHVTVPLIVFYRFHASVCLVDIWQSAYEIGD
uniref:Proton channel OtopLc n=1 Tax=Timema monikensis TaxID=170555 RepID=A0A7R9HIJ5_9NEOP|nr:unnamed protein product [Timema monikensis]